MDVASTAGRTRVRSVICGCLCVGTVAPTPMSSVEQIWQVAKRVWKGKLLLVTRKQIEDGDFWKEHDIVLAVSMNGGCFKDGPKAWFEYPVGRKALNIPIAYDEGRVPRMRFCLPFIMAALAAGKNVALHCLHTVHRGLWG